MLGMPSIRESRRGRAAGHDRSGASGRKHLRRTPCLSSRSPTESSSSAAFAVCRYHRVRRWEPAIGKGRHDGDDELRESFRELSACRQCRGVLQFGKETSLSSIGSTCLPARTSLLRQTGATTSPSSQRWVSAVLSGPPQATGPFTGDRPVNEAVETATSDSFTRTDSPSQVDEVILARGIDSLGCANGLLPRPRRAVVVLRFPTALRGETAVSGLGRHLSGRPRIHCPVLPSEPPLRVPSRLPSRRSCSPSPC